MRNNIFLSGFTFIRNGKKLDYPFIEVINSLISVCDEVVVNVVSSEDETLEWIKRIKDKKLRIIETPYRGEKGAAFFEKMASIPLKECRGEWLLHLQGDEIPTDGASKHIIPLLRKFSSFKKIEGFTFRFRHFYVDYWHYYEGYGWFPREVRIIRNGIGIMPYKDSPGFRRNGRKLKVLTLPFYIHHYGWVKERDKMILKQVEFHRYYNREFKISGEPYTRFSGLRIYRGEHPAVMQKRVKAFKREDIPISLTDPGKRRRFQECIDDLTERYTNRRILEYENFIPIGRFGPPYSPIKR